MHRSPPVVPVLAAVCVLLVFGLVGMSRIAADVPASTSMPRVVRLGYLPNLTHATALVGIERGSYRRALSGVRLETRAFNAGPDAALALISGAVDAAYLGPNPAINAFLHSDGEALRVVAGATSGGASLVVRQGIHTPEDLKGARLATPQLGGTQDVALRWWLSTHGIDSTTEGSVVQILPQKNGQTVSAFRQGILDGAWVPEPWASRLVREAGAHVLVDERELWPEGRDVTTVLAVRTDFLHQHPDLVRRLIEGQVAVNRFIVAHPEESRRSAVRAIERITGEVSAPDVVDAAWGQLSFADDLDVASLSESARRAHAVGLLPRTDLDGLVDLRMLHAARSVVPSEDAVKQ